MSTSRSRRETLHEIIFEADTPIGKAFDVALLVAIVASVVVVMLDSVKGIAADHRQLLTALEWGFTIFFTIEYVLRLSCVNRPARYATSFFGVVDLLAILPTYISLLIPGSQALIVIRALRLLRIFRVFKLARYVGESAVLMEALRASRAKITVFLLSVATIVLVIGSAMYLIEGEQSGFTSIPRSVYWAIVTMTTVGYGDIAPQTPQGQFLAALVMILGYGIIAVPTGIVTAELTSRRDGRVSTQACPACGTSDHATNARFCKHCGEALHTESRA